MLATAQKIRTIDYSKSSVIGTGTMSPRARRTLAVYSILIKWGYDGISAPAGAIADAIYRSSCGAAASIRTLQRANKELSERGYISCPTFRPGQHSRGTLIKFHKDSFRFFGQENSERRSMCDTQLHAPTCRPSELTNQQYTNNSQHINKLEEPRAGARASNNKTSQKKSSVLFSLNIVLGGMTMHRIDRRTARARARCEMDAIVAGAELLSPSGVDWQYWETRWPEMTIQARESTCRREIIPLLVGEVTKREARMADAPKIDARKGADVDRDAISPDEIRRVRENLFCRSVDVVSVGDAGGSDTDTDGQNYLGADEMSILSAARERADMRRSNNLGVASVSDLLNRR